MKFSSLLTLAAAAEAANNISAIEVRGNAFFDSSSGDRFYIRGVDYQPGGSSNLTDPLADPDVCGRDIPYFQQLGLNTIRVYSIDNSQDHTECMQLLNQAGIYLILDLNTPDASISRHDPGCSYNSDYMNEVFSTVDEFAEYDNVLGFFAANELVNNEGTLDTAPYIKAVVRDTKQYIHARGYRQIPVGYSAADVSSLRKELADYLNCGNDSDARIDMLGVNDYSWCGNSNFVQSGYRDKVTLYTGYSIPLFLSEYGCNTVGTSRSFSEVQSIYSSQMSSVFSGGLVYQWTEDSSRYGLVSVSGDHVSTLTDYNNFRSELSSTHNPSGNGGYSTSNSVSECPTDWNFTIAVPPTPSGVQQLISHGATGGLGFNADTQDACDADNVYRVSTEGSGDAGVTAGTHSSAEVSSYSTVAGRATAVNASSSSSSSGIAANLEAHFGGVVALLAGLFLF